MELSRQKHAKNLKLAWLLCIFVVRFKINIIMATIELRLSSKIQDNGRSEVLLRLYQGSKLNLRAKTGVYVCPEHFEYYIDRKNTLLTGGKVSDKAVTMTLADAIKNKVVVFERGEVVVKNRIESEDKTYHDKAKDAIDNLKKTIISEYEKAAKDTLTSAWLQTVIDKFHHPEKYQEKEEEQEKRSFFDYITDFRDNAKKKVNGKREGDKSDVWKKNFDVLIRALRRYEMFVRLSDKERKDFTLDIDTIDSDTLSDIESYLRNEHSLLEEYPKIFENIPASTDSRRSPKPQPRGNNTICALFNKLKAFFNWLNEKNITANNPFKGYEGVVSEQYGTPYYITLEERNHIADFDLSKYPNLSVQRDIFIFQCCIGCRVSDLLKLTQSNVINGAVEYIPHKTKGERQNVVRVPLNGRASALMEKYKGVDSKGHLFPFIAAQNYNDSIKEIFRLCGITRAVTVINSITGKEEQRPINEVASSHMARRTFVGNLYKKVKDPSLISSMSGHAEGSKAFNRYREIDDEVKKATVSLID